MTRSDRIIAAAMAARGLDPEWIDCPCCGDTTHRDDMMADRMSETKTAAILDRYGRPICMTCADDHECCEICGAAIPPAETEWTDGYAECPGCAGTLAEEWRLDEAHERQERHGWEQV